MDNHDTITPGNMLHHPAWMEHNFSGQVYLKTLAPINLTNEGALASRTTDCGNAEAIPMGAAMKR